MKHAGAIALLLFFSIASAGEPAERRPGRPGPKPPLLSIRASRPAALETLFETPLFRSLGLGEADYGGRLHGMGVRVESLRSLLRRLDREKAADIGYFLFQKGESLAGISASISWTWPGDASPADAGAALRRLEENGVALNGTAMELLPAEGGRRLAAAADQEAMRQLLDAVRGQPETPGAADIRVVLNPRPLLGFASLAGGIDFRTLATRLRLAIPSRLELDMRDSAAPGLALRLPGLFQSPPRKSAMPVPLAAGRDDALATLILPSPADWLAAVGLGSNFLHPANMDSTLLAPHSISATIWRDAAGQARWLAVCPVNNTRAIHNQYLRLMAWIEAMASSFGLQVERLDEGEERKTLLLRTAAISLCVRIDFPGEKRGGYAYFMAAGRLEDIPAGADIVTRARSGPPCLLEWDIRLDEMDKSAAADALAAALRKLGIAVARPDLLPDAFASREQGSITADGDTLIIDSPAALPLLAFPAIEKYMKGIAGQRRNRMK